MIVLLPEEVPKNENSFKIAVSPNRESKIKSVI